MMKNRDMLRRLYMSKARLIAVFMAITIVAGSVSAEPKSGSGNNTSSLALTIGYLADYVVVWIDDRLVFQGTVYTDESTGFAANLPIELTGEKASIKLKIVIPDERIEEESEIVVRKDQMIMVSLDQDAMAIDVRTAPKDSLKKWRPPNE
ncbi:MAG: hypothetical protein AAF591_17690 [Verrucomicrobiota bacterium]